MSKKTIITLCFIIGAVILAILISNPLTTQKVSYEVIPSETVKEYSDPSGFTFNYPDNLSLDNNEVADDSTYADIQLSSKDVNGSLSLKITDSKYATLDEWLRLNKGAVKTTKEVKLGDLKAFEAKTNDRLFLGALDKGIFFAIEMPLVEENFWTKVYDQILADFSFTAPEIATAQAEADTSSDDVIFEGEEVVP